MARAIDHLVLPTASLESARARLAALGFTVAPTGVHPFGTVNACVYLADGTFLEPLAIGSRQAADEAVEAGNVFVARDRQFREFHGENGFSAVVFASGDADADHADSRGAAFSAGDMLAFSRPFVDAAGRSDTASFRLAFAAPAGSTGTFAFACQRLNAPKVDRTALQRHANGVTRILSVVAVADDPTDARRFLSQAAGAGEWGGATVALPNAALTVLDRGAFADAFGTAAPAGPLRLAAISFGVTSLAATQNLFSAQGIAYIRRDGRLVVQPAAGQGAVFAFEETARESA